MCLKTKEREKMAARIINVIPKAGTASAVTNQTTVVVTPEKMQQ